MPLSDLAALEISGVVLTPFIAAFLKRTCGVDPLDCFFALLAVVGIVILVKPVAIFGNDSGDQQGDAVHVLA